MFSDLSLLQLSVSRDLNNAGSVDTDGGSIQVDRDLNNDGTVKVKNGRVTVSKVLRNRGTFKATLQSEINVDSIEVSNT